MGKRHPWDTSMKLLFAEASIAFVSWLKQDAQFVQLVATELEDETIYSDILCEVQIKGRKALLHVEFQKKRDSNMAERLWQYNVRATLKYKCPVWSYVIYLTKDSVVKPFYSQTFLDGPEIHHFNFSVIKLWEIPTQELLEAGLSDLAPLLTLTREGQRREVVERAIEILDPQEGERKSELLTLTYGLASLIFNTEADQDWLVWRFSMLYEILKDTRAFRELAKEGLEEGLKEGRREGLKEGLEEGIKKGLIGGIRLSVLDMIEARFADQALVESARSQVNMLDDEQTLRHLVGQVVLLQKPEELAPLLAQCITDASTSPLSEELSHARPSTKKVVE